MWSFSYIFLYFRAKRARYGIKIYFTCPGDKDWQGYSYNFALFYGAGSEVEIPSEDGWIRDVLGDEELLKSEIVVVKMLDGHFGKWAHVYIDNWYTSKYS